MLSADFGHLERDTQMIDRSAAEWVHIDVMDGVFVPNISFGFPVLKAIRKATAKCLDVHLMIVEPERYVARFAEAGAPVAGVYFCPHHPEKANPPYRMDCDCRKPRPGMLLKAAEDLGIDLSTSIMFGDKPGDMTAGRAAGCVERIQLGTDGLEAPVPSADATGAFRSLADAVASPWFAQLKQRSLP